MMNKVTLNVLCLISDSCCFSGTTAVYCGETFFCDDSQVKKCLEETYKCKTGKDSKYIYIYIFFFLILKL